MEWLILIPILAAIGWFWKGLRLWKPLRAAALLLLVFSLVQPQCNRSGRGMDLWVLIDRSASASEVVTRDMQEWKALLERSKPGENDNLYFIEYANDAIGPDLAEAPNFSSTASLTRTNLAIHATLAQVNPDRHSRLLAFTDGFSTEPLDGAREKLQEMEVPLDLRLLNDPKDQDYRILDLNLPPRVQLGEPFMIDVQIGGNGPGPVDLTILRNGNKITSSELTLDLGRAGIRFTDRLTQPGSYRYEAIISAEGDAFSGNNTRENWIEISSGPRILLVTRYENDPIARVLRAQGFEVEVANNPQDLHIGNLSGCKTVIFNNVPAYEVSIDFLNALDFFVRNQGGGFLMAGGKYSFGSGGYFQSAIDELLPVSMELQNEHRKLAVAMSIVMDRSGSMGATVKGSMTKMDLANEGAARAVELLGHQDTISVYAVDSSSHEIVPNLTVGPNRDKILARVRRIQSLGGGIFVYTGLKEAWQSLKKIEVGQRHIILFTDAADSEEPGKYKELIKDIVANGGSVSVIGLGTDKDADANFIKDIAKRGNGRIFFTTDPITLPNIFAQETVTIARSAFIKEPVGTKPTGGWFEISSDSLSWLPDVDAYNLSYLRENATAALLSTDEYSAPLVAFAQRGIGRSAALSFPLGGEFSDRIRNWDKFGDFLQTLTRWMMGTDTPPGVALRTKVNGTRLELDLFYDEEKWADRIAEKPPKIIIAHGANANQVENLTWERLSPGHFRTTRDLTAGTRARGAIQIGQSAIPFGPVVIGGDAEWEFDESRIAELQSVSDASGGSNLVDLKTAWTKPDREERTGFQNYLWLLALLCALADALVTRMGWQLPHLSRLKTSPKSKPKPKTSPRKESPTVTAPEPPEEPKPEPPSPDKKPTDSPDKSRSRFKRAKRN